MDKLKTAFGGAIVLYFIIGLEVLIMISPFAGFFYAVFNPVLLEASRYPATRWLSAFFLPHMVVPPDNFLKAVRVAGSVLFVLGISVFLFCALQVYWSKFRKKGAVTKGLYSFIRHPQYLGLGMAGIGLAILWPRFLVAVLWLCMALVYYLLSKDEERRMLKEHGQSYENYMERTGMFLPKAMEKAIAPSGVMGKAAIFALIAVFTVGGAFFLRHYTISRLPLWSSGSVVALSIVPEDEAMMNHRMGDILGMAQIRARLGDGGTHLVYFMPENYVMQGLIADTGGQWRLYKRHHALGMIADWIFHPFGHLKGGGHMHGHDGAAPDSSGVIRRLVFVRIGNVDVREPSDVFALEATREPRFMADVDVHDLRLIDLKDLPPGTGWGAVPTPVF
jgi:protein-S-isoprenylcysteine O-methyltransferase Ste14